MCTPVYVTVKAATSLAPMMASIVGAVILGLSSVVCFFKGFKTERVPSK